MSISNVNQPNYVGLNGLPLSERPYEKIDRHGISNLSNAELIAVVLRTGKKGYDALSIARHLLGETTTKRSPSTPERSLRWLANMRYEELREVPGLGPIKAKQIMATMEIAKRLNHVFVDEQPIISTPDDAANLFRRYLVYGETEEVWCAFLTVRCQLIAVTQLAKGALDHISFHPREIFKEAFRLNAHRLILAHNHPSGHLKPSASDIHSTQMMVQLGQQLGLEIIDHLILSNMGYTSLRKCTSCWMTDAE